MGLALDEPKENEKIVQVCGLEVLMDERVLSFAPGQVLDYVSSRHGQGFLFRAAGGSSCS